MIKEPEAVEQSPAFDRIQPWVIQPDILKWMFQDNGMLNDLPEDARIIDATFLQEEGKAPRVCLVFESESWPKITMGEAVPARSITATMKDT